MVTRSTSRAKPRVKPKPKARAKPSVKPRTVKKAVKKPAKKRATAKTATRKTTTRKAPTKIADRDTLIKLRAHVDDIEKRLKRANSLTRTSVRALKTSYEALDGDNHTTALTGHIEELSDRLTGMIEQTRADVAHDLKIVLGDPRLETLSGALTKANQRLTAAEQNQAEAINAINTHIARLASAVDERMQREQRQREKGHALLSARMDTIEHDSAAAITTIGDKVVSISEDLAQKAQALQGDMAEKALLHQQDYEEHKHQMARRIEAIEDDQLNQLPAFERDIETLSTRLEALESNIGMYGQPVEPVISESAYDTAPRIAEQDGTGQDAIGQDETIHDEASHYESTKADDAFAALELVDMQEVEAPTYTHEPVSEPEPIYAPETYAPEMVPETAHVPVAPEMPHAYAPVEYGAAALATAVDGQNPETFSPRAYVPGGMSSGGQDVQADLPPSIAVVVDNGPQVYVPQDVANTMSAPQAYGEQQVYDPAAYDSATNDSATNDPTFVPAPPPFMPDAGQNTGLPPMPVAAVPEIQTLEPSMESVRPGAEPEGTSKKGKKRKAKKAKNNGGSGGGHGVIRKVALFGGVAVVALFAYKTFAPRIFGADDTTPRTTQAAPAKSLATIQVSGGSDARAGERPDQRPDARPGTRPNARPGEYTTTDGQTFESVEPVGDYSETMAAPDLGGRGATAQAGQQKTLEAAASAGNAIAQFQLGLSHLEAGRDADAVRLIRLAANQGQPAAQYRLAKLYEAGIGVKVNGKTAKDLLMRSAKAGNRIAMHDLGHYYATGADGSAPDLQQAVKWFSMAAERGVLDSQFNLAVLYQGGSGVPLSLEDAYVWYAIAGIQGDKIAAQRSETVARELSDSGLAKAKARVKAYAPKPVDNAANGVFKNLSWITEKDASVKPKQNTSVQGAQKMLASLGYSVGTPDGTLGPNTRNAIISFERANGLPQTGRVNAALIERLQLAAGV